MKKGAVKEIYFEQTFAIKMMAVFMLPPHKLSYGRIDY